MVGEHLVQASDCRVKRGMRPKTEKDHASVGMMLDEDQLAKIPIEGDENASFSIRNGEDFRVNQTGGVLEGDGADIVSQFLQVRSNAHISALVQEEPHALAFASSALFLEAAKASLLSGDRR